MRALRAALAAGDSTAGTRAQALVVVGSEIADNPPMTETPDYRGNRFPREIIARAARLYYRLTLSFRDVECLLAERSIIVSYETVAHRKNKGHGGLRQWMSRRLN